MPASKEDLRLKLMEVVNALSESQGSTPQEIIEMLNAIPAQDFTKADEDNANQNIVASVEDESSLAEARAKADSAYSNMGRRAPAPFAGEKSMDYRKRALIGAQRIAKNSEMWIFVPFQILQRWRCWKIRFTRLLRKVLSGPWKTRRAIWVKP